MPLDNMPILVSFIKIIPSVFTLAFQSQLTIIEKVRAQGGIMKKEAKTRDMTIGAPLTHLIEFTIPILFGILFQQFYNTADSMIVGRLLGADALGAVGCTGNVSFLTIGLCMGTCTGFAVPVSQYFGARDEKHMKKCVGNSIWLSAAFSFFFLLLTTVFCRRILMIMRTPEDILDMAYDYLFVIFLGIPASILYNLLSAYLRALGNSRMPLISLILSSVLNILTDILFISVFHMGVGGAAWATILSQAVSGIVCLIYIVRKFEPLHVGKEDLKPDKRIVRKLLSAGLPMGLQYSITAIGGSILQASINGLGKQVITTFSIGGRVEGFLGCVFNALGSTMATYCGQNVGAGKYDRVKKGIRAALLISFVYSVLVFFVLLFFGKSVALIFVNKEETEIIGYVGKYLVILGASFILLALVNVVRPAIQGMGFASVAMFAGLCELVGRGLAGIILVPKFGFYGACFGAPAAWILADIFLVTALSLLLKKAAKKSAAPTTYDD